MARKLTPNSILQKKINEIKDLMKKQGVYQSGLEMQIKLVAQLAIKTDNAFMKTIEPEFDSIVKQVSREGNEREILNGYETLFKQYSERLQNGLRALGLNYDSKPIKGGNDAFDDFYNSFQIDDNE